MSTNPPLLMLIDVGNTNIVLGVCEGKRLLDHWRIHTEREQTADELGILTRQLLLAKDIDPNRVQNGILSCVVPPMVSQLEEMARRYFKFDLLVVEPGIRMGMPILVENPKEVGADRIVNAIAAYELHPEGLIVVDFGTATTFDVVSPKGEYLGGAISPGMAISADALFRHAAKLPKIPLARPKRVVGKNTIASMQSGLIFGYAGLVTEMVRRMKAELDFSVRVLATGGLAHLIANETDAIDAVLEDLTLDGLRIIFARNQE